MRYIKLFFVFILLIVTGCANSKGYSKITYDELFKKLENKEDFLLMISSSTCPHCEQFKITLEEINKKYKINIKYIDINELSNEQMLAIKAHFPYKGTPATIKIVNGKEENSLSRIDGAQDYSYTKQKLIDWNYIKE